MPAPVSGTATATASPSDLAGDPHADGAAVLGGVLDEVGEHLLDLVRVGVDRGEVVGEVDRAVEVLDPHADLLDDRGGQRREVDHLAAQDEATGLEPADVEQLGDQAGDPVGVVVDLLEHRLLLVVVEPVPAARASATCSP